MAKAPNKNNRAPAAVSEPVPTQEPLPTLAVPAPEPLPKRLPAGNRHFNLDNSGSKVAWYLATIPKHDTLDDILDPSYWTHHTNVSPKSIIMALGEEGGYEVWLRVIERTKTFLRVAPIHYVKYEVRAQSTEARNKLIESYRIEQLDQHGWRAIDRDNNIIIDGQATRAQVEAYVEKYVDVMFPQTKAAA